MRTLTRPMFNMGGPIKQGVMHGIREPHKDGKIVGGHQSPLLAGAHPWKDRSGREHHVLPAIWAGALGLSRFAPSLYRALSAGKNIKNISQATNLAAKSGKTFKNVGASYDLGKIGSAGAGAGSAAAAPVYTGMKGYFMRDPLVKSALWAKRALMSPTSKGWGKSALRFATAPSSLALGAWMGYDKLTGKKEIDPPKTGGGVPGGGDPGMTYTSPEKEIKVLSDDERKAFANKQRNERVEKYLKLMGYDRSKKMAIADALIDASKIVGDRGSLEAKNITQELINPIIQATSKRLDKPAQIREAVGLMATKAEIEKDLSKERDALKTQLTELQIEGAKETLKSSRSFEGGLSKFISDRKGKVDKVTLERISRLLADTHGESFIKTDEDTVVSGDGIYMIGDGIYRVTDGVEKQIA